MCSSAGWRLPTAANLLTLPSLGPAGAQAQNDDGAVFGRECLTLCGILCGAYCNVDSSTISAESTTAPPVKFATLGRPVKRPMLMAARGEPSMSLMLDDDAAMLDDGVDAFQR